MQLQQPRTDGAYKRREGRRRRAAICQEHNPVLGLLARLPQPKHALRKITTAFSERHRLTTMPAFPEKFANPDHETHQNDALADLLRQRQSRLSLFIRQREGLDK